MSVGAYIVAVVRENTTIVNTCRTMQQCCEKCQLEDTVYQHLHSMVMIICMHDYAKD